MVGNIRHWPATTFEWRGVTRDLRKGGPIEMLTTSTIANLINIKVLWHHFSNLMFNLHYMCLLSQVSSQKYTNKFQSKSLITI